MRGRWLYTLLIMTAGFIAVPPAPDAAELTVSAAMSLKAAFEEMGALYQETHAGTRVAFNFGPSGGLARQIEAGAPVDLFASASQKDMNDLEAKGLVLEGTRNNFAGNSVVLVVPAGAGSPAAAFEDLGRDSVQRIAVANPKTAPAGRYGMEVFAFYGIAEAVRPKLVLAENVRQVIAYVSRGEVEAGLVYRTDALAVKEGVRMAASAPADAHAPVLYPVAIIKTSEQLKAAGDFLNFLRSPLGQTLLKRHGFTSGEPGEDS